MSTNMKSLVVQMSERFGVEPTKFYETLKATAFKQRDGSAPTDDQMMTLMIVAEQYRLNPFTKEIYAFPDKNNGIIPVVGVDGWARIINDHPSFDGIEFEYSNKMVTMDGAKVTCPEWVECVIFRTDRTRPIRIREYLDEVYRAPFKGIKNGRSFTAEGPWQTHTKRQLRHKALIQCSRVAFGFGGIYDQDEAERIRDIEGEVINATHNLQVSQSAPVNQQQPAANQKASAPLMIEKQEEIKLFVDRVVERSKVQNAWAAGGDLIEQRFNSKQEREFAMQQFRTKQEEHLLALPETPVNNQQPANVEPKVEVQVEMSEQNIAQPIQDDLVVPVDQEQEGYF